MIKILPLNENRNVEPYFYLDICLGYGEHCDDNFSHSIIYIDDKKANSTETSGYITAQEAETIVKFFANILGTRENKSGSVVDHLVLNEGVSEFWHHEVGGMSDEEFYYFMEFYDKFESSLNPKVEYNWYGITNVSIKYVDENGNKHNCDVI